MQLPFLGVGSKGEEYTWLHFTPAVGLGDWEGWGLPFRTVISEEMKLVPQAGGLAPTPEPLLCFSKIGLRLAGGAVQGRVNESQSHTKRGFCEARA